MAMPANALTISYDDSAASADDAQIKAAVNLLDSLYSNNVTVDVTFSIGSIGGASTTQNYYAVNYSTYTAALKADSVANPINTVLATAVSNLGKGNDAGGTSQMALTSAQARMLGIAGISVDNSQIVLGSGLSGTALTNAILHELDEVLGGGGAGSTLNGAQQGVSFFSNKYGATDLYRYSAANTPSWSTSGSATAYFSIDGGVTNLHYFNQDSSGDYGDFTNGGAAGGVDACVIQSAFICSPADNYVSGSLENIMEESIGWDPVATPVPAALPLFATGTALMGFLGWRRRRKAGRAGRGGVSVPVPAAQA